MTVANAGPVEPPTVARTAASRATISPTVDRNAGSVTFAVALAMTTVMVSDGVALVPPAFIAWKPRAASVVDPLPGPPVALSALIPPIDVLTAKSPMVSTNHATNTGQR